MSSSPISLRIQRRTASGYLLCAFFVTAIVTASGCGSSGRDLGEVPVHPAKGTLTFKGQPTPGATISFHPKAPLPEGVPNPRATVKADGAFATSTYVSGDGAPEGEYVVTVKWYKPIEKNGDLVAGPNVIPKQFSNPQTSKLEIRIAAGENQLEPIQL